MIQAITTYLCIGCCVGIADELAAPSGQDGSTFRENVERATHTVVCWPYFLWRRLDP